MLYLAYNVQSTVDAKYNIPINYEVTNENDFIGAFQNMICNSVFNAAGEVIVFCFCVYFSLDALKF